jgi:hypothetical protein
MDIGSQTIYQIISEKLLSLYTSKLCILAIGFNSSAVASLVASAKQSKSQPVSFIVANKAADITAVRLSLASNPAFVDHSETILKEKRAKNYLSGGIFLVTHMKFALDVLDEYVLAKNVDKIILVNEYEVGEYHPLALAVNILKRGNSVDQIYLKDILTMAIVNDPFKAHAKANYESLMKNIYLTDCQFWPVYREEIKDFIYPGEEERGTEIPRVVFKVSQNIIEEFLVADDGKVKELQKLLITILKSCLENLRIEFKKVCNEKLPMTTADLTEMSREELWAALKQLPNNFHSDYVSDIVEIRRILASFGHQSRVQVLVLAARFARISSEQTFYKGF